MIFREYLKNNVLKTNQRILEFGPLTRPLVTKDSHPGINYADVRSTEEIKKLYQTNEYLKSTGIKVDVDSIVNIDYVVKDSYKKTFKDIEKFDVVLLSHVIEHMPDIIFFFDDVMNLLKEHGKLVIIYPDSRYCFDHFRNGTSFIDAYDVFKNKKNSANRVLDFVFNVVHENNPNLFWDGSSGSILPKNEFRSALKAYEKAHNNELPDDTHFWPFADYQFIKFLYDMERANLLGLRITEFYPTQENTQEFMIILQPKNNKFKGYNKYRDLLNYTTPTAVASDLRKKNALMSESLDKLSNENDRLKTEINEIYESKKWKYVSRIANIRSKFNIKNDEK